MVVTKSSESEIQNVLVSVVLFLLLVCFVCSFLLVGLYFLLLFSVHLPRLFTEVDSKTKRLFTQPSIRQEIIGSVIKRQFRRSLTREGV